MYTTLGRRRRLAVSSPPDGLQPADSRLNKALDSRHTPCRAAVDRVDRIGRKARKESKRIPGKYIMWERFEVNYEFRENMKRFAGVM
jgi:hypothetical protein